MYECMCIYVYVDVYPCLWCLYVHRCMHVHIHVYVCVCTFTPALAQYMCVQMYRAIIMQSTAQIELAPDDVILVFVKQLLCTLWQAYIHSQSFMCSHEMYKFIVNTDGSAII